MAEKTTKKTATAKAKSSTSAASKTAATKKTAAPKKAAAKTTTVKKSNPKKTTTITTTTVTTTVKKVAPKKVATKSSAAKKATSGKSVRAKTLNDALNAGKKTRDKNGKSTLEKYYISEKPIKKTGDVIFNFKRAKQKTAKSFDTFVDALNEFIRIAEESSNPCRVWFHRDGAYRGSVDLIKAQIIRQRLTRTQIENKKVIEYIETEDLVDKAEPKGKKVEIDFEREQRLLNKSVDYVDLNVENSKNRYVQDIMVPDVRTYSPGNVVVVEEIKPNIEDNSLEVWYHLEKDIEDHHLVSNQGTQTLRDFKVDKEPIVVEKIIEKHVIVEKPVEEPAKVEEPVEEVKPEPEVIVLPVQEEEKPVENEIDESVKEEIVENKDEDDEEVPAKKSDPWFAILAVILTLLIIANIVVLIVYNK